MACKVKANRHGFLAFRFYWNGQEFWQGTDWRDTLNNRKKAEGKAQEITEEIKARTFDYLKWFPNGNKAHLFRPKKNAPELVLKPQTVKQRYDAWIESKRPPFVRRSLERDYRQAFKKHIIPFMGDLELTAVTAETLESFRLYLVEDCRVKLKTARNVIDGPLRAFFRDSRRYLETNPFNDLSDKWWPRPVKAEPDPFSELERDAILRFYRAKRPFKDYALVYFRFYTGTRPSEAVALKWGRVDLHSGKATINSSRTFGEDNAPKTEASARTITLLPNVLDVVKSLLPLHLDAEDYVFTDFEGKPVDQNEFGRKFTSVLRVLKIRPRRFYNTRHTYVSVALTLGCNPKWIAEQTGTSLIMIQQNYGKYIRDDGDALLRRYVATAQTLPETVLDDPETETFSGTFFAENANYANRLVVPTGIEPKPAKNTNDAEQPDVIDISKLKKAEG
jgi:integrase